jgi:AcrR family transcriptional regulator
MKYPGRQGYRMRARAHAMVETRERILRAMMKLAFAQAYEEITLAAIAHEARVSHQTVLNHFDSKEGVAAAAAEILNQETIAARDRAKPGDVVSAIRVLVGEYERFGDAGVRWALSPERLGSLAPLLERARAHHQSWLQRIFAAALPADAERRTRVIHGLHAATDVYTWKLLRRDLKLTRPETETIMVNLVRGVLAEPSARRHRRRTQRSTR